MIGSPLLEMSLSTSGWLKRRIHVVDLVSCSCWNICCASTMLCTGVSFILMSQAPRRFVRHRGIRSPGVCGDMVASRKRLLCSMKLRPAVLCRVGLNLRRFNSSSKAWWYGLGDMYIVAMLVLPMRYWVNRSAAVCLLVGFLSGGGRVVVVLAAVAVKSGVGVTCSGSE